MIIEYLTDLINNFLKGLINSVPEEYKVIAILLVYIIFIAMYSLFIWRFHRLLSDKEVIKLDLNKYNKSNNPGLKKILAIILFTIEYLVLLPFLVLFWFIIFSILLLILSETRQVEQIIQISSAIIISIRILSYIDENLSKSLARILPFTILAIFVMSPDFFNIEGLYIKITQVPSLLNYMYLFIILIFIIEFVLRIGDSSSQLLTVLFKKQKKEKKTTKEEILEDIKENQKEQETNEKEVKENKEKST